MDVAMPQHECAAQLPCRVLLVFPRFFAASFWNFDESCKVLGVRHPAPPLGLITVAALLPPNWQMRLIDCNVEALTDSDLAQADLVLTGGMLPQRTNTFAIVERCRALGTPVAVGGPDATSSSDLYRRANFLVLGEAESVMEQFVAAWNNGEREGAFVAEKFSVDVTTSPLPRFELLDFRNYLFVNVQYSRGCPFNCEFCDIIELYGRVPRAKSNAQMLTELERLYALGYRGHVDFVDDNLIGNKKALRQFLPELIAWQNAHGFPFEFSTEASVNLADDDQLLRMLRDANFFAVFVGIESPDTDTLIAAQKKQNTRRSLVASINKIYAAGIFVTAGFIVGFDGERQSVAAGMIKCIEETAIPMCMVGLLYALPETQLTRRLAREGRLGERYESPTPEGFGDQCTAGLNFETARPRRDILTDYLVILETIYAPDAFFARARALARRLRCRKRASLPSMHSILRDANRFLRIAWAMTIRRPWMARGFLTTIGDCAWHNPRALRRVIQSIVLYVHVGGFAREVATKIRAQIDEIDRHERLDSVPQLDRSSQSDAKLHALDGVGRCAS